MASGSSGGTDLVSAVVTVVVVSGCDYAPGAPTFLFHSLDYLTSDVSVSRENPGTVYEISFTGDSTMGHDCISEFSPVGILVGTVEENT